MFIFSDRLRQLRIDKNFTKKKLAKIIGVSYNTITRWENNKTSPKGNSLKLLANVFDCTSDYLLGLKNQPKNTSDWGVFSLTIISL